VYQVCLNLKLLQQFLNHYKNFNSSNILKGGKKKQQNFPQKLKFHIPTSQFKLHLLSNIPHKAVPDINLHPPATYNNK
jgi:hypothetical protein